MSGWAGVKDLAVPPGIQADEIEGDGLDVVIEAGLGQPSVAGTANVGDLGCLGDGGFDPGSSGVAALPAGVTCSALAVSRACWIGRGRSVSCLPPRAAVVHFALTGHAWQTSPANFTTMTSVPRWTAGVQQALVLPCGQQTVDACHSMVNPVRSKPSPARACGEVSASIGVTNRTPRH